MKTFRSSAIISAPLGSPVLTPGSRLARSSGSSSPLVRVRAPEFAILGQTVHLYCNFSLPEPHTNFYTLKVRHQTPERDQRRGSQVSWPDQTMSRDLILKM